MLLRPKSIGWPRVSRAARCAPSLRRPSAFRRPIVLRNSRSEPPPSYVGISHAPYIPDGPGDNEPPSRPFFLPFEEWRGDSSLALGESRASRRCGRGEVAARAQGGRLASAPLLKRYDDVRADALSAIRNDARLGAPQVSTSRAIGDHMGLLLTRIALFEIPSRFVFASVSLKRHPYYEIENAAGRPGKPIAAPCMNPAETHIRSVIAIRCRRTLVRATGKLVRAQY